MGKAQTEQNQEHANQFGTFGGVFTPCTLTILGVIMFLRFGQVVGQSGIFHALLIILAAKTITTLTTLSLSAIATNTRVKAGGAYYLISRSLGPEFGGAIGTVFFAAQAVSVAMYVVGFTEAMVAVLGAFWPDAADHFVLVATITNIAVFVCVFIGAGWTIKVQYGILAILVLSLLSFFAGAIGQFDVSNLQVNWQSGYGERSSFLMMFALFFPAATGIMAGANMSGDLREPGKAIPRGTLLSILVTGVVYATMAVALGGGATRDVLLTDNMVVQTTALVPVLITAGVFAATLSSALGSMMGAPRILQALARDQVFRKLRFFGQGSGKSNEPRRATVLTFLIAQVAIMLGDLDAIAPIITMFFMITYGYLNLATFYESLARNPSYRPTFKFSHWSLALLGALGCLGAMVLISPVWAVISIVAMYGLHRFIKRQNIQAAWGDVQSGAAMERARRDLLRLEEERYHPKNWRPNILSLTGGARDRPHLAVYGQWLTGGRGLLTIAQIIAGDSDTHFARRENQEQALRRFIRENELDAFAAVLVAPELHVGIEALVQCYGIGALQPNMVLMGWSEDPKRLGAFAETLRTVSDLKRSLVIIDSKRDESLDPWVPPSGTIDVWWRGKDNGPLMVLLAHLMTQGQAWLGRTIRLLRVIPNEAGREEATKHLEKLITDARIKATASVLIGEDARSIIERESAFAAVVFLGFSPPKEGTEQAFFGAINGMIKNLPNVVLVHSEGQTSLEA